MIESYIKLKLSRWFRAIFSSDLLQKEQLSQKVPMPGLHFPSSGWQEKFPETLVCDSWGSMVFCQPRRSGSRTVSGSWDRRSRQNASNETSYSLPTCNDAPRSVYDRAHKVVLSIPLLEVCVFANFQMVDHIVWVPCPSIDCLDLQWVSPPPLLELRTRKNKTSERIRVTIVYCIWSHTHLPGVSWTALEVSRVQFQARWCL